MRILGLHHVAFAHDRGAVTPGALENLLGLTGGHSEDGPGFRERNLPIAEGFTCLQLLEATGVGVVSRFLDRRGPSLHHVAFAVEDLDAALQELREKGAQLVDEIGRPGGDGTRIAFVHPSSFGGLLVELVEDPLVLAKVGRVSLWVDQDII